MKHAVRVDKLPSPATAWPTVWLGVASLALWTCSAFAGWQYDAPMVITVPVSAVAVYLTFTPMHDAAHRSVSKQHRWLNELVGWACSLVYLVVPFPLFRLIHLTHHKHTNDPDLDPDYIPPTHGVLVTLHLFFRQRATVCEVCLEELRQHRQSKPFIDLSLCQLCLHSLCHMVWLW